MITFNVQFIGKGLAIEGLKKIKDRMVGLDIMAKMGEASISQIKERTLRGYDHEDRALNASMRVRRGGGQTLSDKGHMLGGMRSLLKGPKRSEIFFPSQIEASKALWAQKGTKPHIISAKRGKALAWKTSLSFGNMIVNTRGGVRKARPLTQENARARGQGMMILNHVHHPGTPPRPFFGISPKDEAVLQGYADKLLDGYAREAGAK